MLSLLGEVEDAGGQLVLNSPVVCAESTDEGHVLTIGGEAGLTLNAREVINAAGLSAPELARRWEGLPDTGKPEQWMARGVYFSYSGKQLFATRVNPLPGLGGLGEQPRHATGGQPRFSPDVEGVLEGANAVIPARVLAIAEGIQQLLPDPDP